MTTILLIWLALNLAALAAFNLLLRYNSHR